MVTHKSVNFTFSTCLHFMTIYLLALLHTPSNLDDYPFLKVTNIAHIVSIFVRAVRVRSPVICIKIDKVEAVKSRVPSIETSPW